MSEFSGIVNEMQRQDLQEMTTAGNIAFIPGQFSSVEKLMRDLARAKRTYDIQVLESETEFTLAFEEYASIRVPKPACKEFFADFSRYVHTIGPVPGIYPVDLGGFLLEGVSEEVAGLKGEVQRLLGVLETRHLGYVRESWEQMFALFEGKTEWNNEAVLPQRSMEMLAEEIIREFGDDLGGLQMLLAKLENAEDLSGEPVFENYKYLYGLTHVFEKNGIGLTFESYVGLDYKPFASVRIRDNQVREQLRDRPGLTCVQDMVITDAGVFGFGDLERIRESVDSIVGEVL